MPRVACAVGAWTTLPDLGAAHHVYAADRGIYLSTAAAAPADIGEAIPIPSKASIVISAGLPLHVWAEDLGNGATTVSVVYQRI